MADPVETCAQWLLLVMETECIVECIRYILFDGGSSGYWWSLVVVVVNGASGGVVVVEMGCRDKMCARATTWGSATTTL